MKNLISYFVGGHADLLEVESLKDWTRPVICSDGAYGCILKNRFVNLAFRECAENTVEECYKSGSKDYITAIAIARIDHDLNVQVQYNQLTFAIFALLNGFPPPIWTVSRISIFHTRGVLQSMANGIRVSSYNPGMVCW